MKRAITYLLLMALLGSCNPVKRVMRNPSHVDQVVAKWRMTHPLDTLKVVIRGTDTVVIRETVRVDSIKLPYPINHRYTEVRIKDRLVTDTVYLRDTAMTGVLIRKIGMLEVAITELRAENKSLRGFKIGVIFLAVTALLIGIFSVVKKFKLI